MKNDQMYLHPEVETLSRPDIEKLQLKRLKATIDRCMHSPFYKERFQQCGIKPEDIQSLEDLQKIPFTTKQDLRDHYPFGLSAVPLDPFSAEIVKFSAVFLAKFAFIISIPH